MAKRPAESRYLYFARYPDDWSWIKIGITCNIRRRMRELHAEPVLVILGDEDTPAAQIEASLHERFNPIRVVGEWFEATEELLEFIWLSTHGEWPLDGHLIDLCEVW